MSEIKNETLENENWIPGLARFIQQREDVEAIIVDAQKKKIVLGTIGDVDEGELEKCVQETLKGIQKELIQGQNNLKMPEGFTVKPDREGTLVKMNNGSKPYYELQWRHFEWPRFQKEHHHEEDWRILLFFAGLCGLCGLIGFITDVATIGPSWLPVAFYIIALIAGGWDAAQDVKYHLPRGELDIHFLMLAVAVGAISIGAWKEGALLLFLFSLSGALEHFAKHRTRSAIDSLFKVAPKKAVIFENGVEREIVIESVRPGQIVVIKPGQLFPVDAEIISGETAADEANLTGESVPVNKYEGDTVYSGTINLWGAVKARVIRSAKESSLQKIIRLIQEAQHLKAPSQRFTDKFGTPYTYIILGLTTLMFFVWWLGFGISPFKNIGTSYSAFYRAMTLLVVASPCALVLSIPSAILAAIAWGASHGVLFRGGAAIEKLSEINTVALDKTGTLTTGDLKVTKIESFPPGKEDDVLAVAYSLEKKASHPLARAIVAYGKMKGIKEKDVNEFKSLTGKGVQGYMDEGLCVLGRRGLFEYGPLKEWATKLPPAPEDSTEVWVVYDEIVGRILLKDEIREESRPVLQKLKALGLKTVMLTGDRREAAESVAKNLGLQEVLSGLSPEDKVNIIKGFTDKGEKVAMVGDGVNDAPSLAASYVPVAMGARGSDAALEQSEVVLMNDRIDYFLDAYELSLRASKIIKVNLFISLTAIGLMVGAACFGLVPLTLGVFTHEGSTVFVCLNSLRLLMINR